MFSPTRRSASAAPTDDKRQQRRKRQARRWHERFRAFALSSWQSSRIVQGVCDLFRSSAETARALRGATGSQIVGAGYGRSLRLEPLEARQLLSASRYVNDTWIITNDTGAAGLSSGDTVMSNVGAGDTLVSGLTFGTDAFSTIPSAVGASGDGVGDSVNVLKGTYSGVINLNKSLSLFGQSAIDVVVNAGTGPGLTLAAGKAATVDDITLQNFGIAGTGVSVKGTLTLTDSIINGGLLGIDVDGSTGHLNMSHTQVLGASIFGLNLGGIDRNGGHRPQ